MVAAEERRGSGGAWLAVFYVALLLCDVAHLLEPWLTSLDGAEVAQPGAWASRRIHLLILAAIPGLYRLFAGRFLAPLTLIYGAAHALHGVAHAWQAMVHRTLDSGAYGGLASLVLGAALVWVSLLDTRH